jgi:hypothetical protein
MARAEASTSLFIDAYACCGVAMWQLPLFFAKYPTLKFSQLYQTMQNILP